MNRLKNYLDSRNLAQLHIKQALESNEKGDTRQAVRMVCAALSYLITANNNLQSLAFNQKPKGKSR